MWRPTIVGVQLIAANEMPTEFWLAEHPSRRELPQDILRSIDAWIRSRQT
jgi:hypothetical protein